MAVAKEFGLTPSSRTRIEIKDPKKEEDEDIERFFAYIYSS